MKCVACGSARVRDAGPLPAFIPGRFGGMPVQARMEPGRLLICPDCTLQFRFPPPSQEQLLALYDALPETIWTDREPRHYWPILFDAMQRYSSNDVVLDVGCYRGDFLAWLPPPWRRLGVEPSREAARVAAERGIDILGATIEESRMPARLPGCATVLDVIEHVVSPTTFLAQVRDRLAANGAMIIMTGATETLPFRSFGRHYWYSSLPEHVTFYSVRWFEWVARQLGMRLVRYYYISSEPKNARLWLRQGGRITVHTLVQALKQHNVPDRVISRLPYGRLALTWTSVPWWKQARDHLIVVLQNPEAQA